jgi:hypothetical protein
MSANVQVHSGPRSSAARRWPALWRAASCPSDSRRPSHALVAYDGNMVAYAKL